jgi:uncharacterized damage-inducible protein DinB
MDPVYPIGKFEMPLRVEDKERGTLIDQIAAVPGLLRAAVAHLSDPRLDTAYRPGGWTVRQVVHHLPDSHLNAYVRFKLALTETEPTIRPYHEELWAEVPEAKIGPIAMSLDLLESLHKRWVAAIRLLPPGSFERAFRHPDIGLMSLNQQLALYAWHGRHHVAQITALAAREGWT